MLITMDALSLSCFRLPAVWNCELTRVLQFRGISCRILRRFSSLLGTNPHRVDGDGLNYSGSFAINHLFLKKKSILPSLTSHDAN
jgi:hypothetical protein